MDQARSLYEDIVAQQYDWIHNAVSSHEEESVLHEFKTKRDPKKPALDGDDRRNYAKCLSGFANESGGVIIWGIRAARGAGDAADVAQSEEPISHLARFVSDLNALSSTAVIPVIPGVENVPVALPGESDRGFVLTYVPRSDCVPHRAMCADNHYYVRTASNTVMMGHDLLAMYFGRRRRPRLCAELRLLCQFTPTKIRPRLILSLRNVGGLSGSIPVNSLRPIRGLEGE